MSDRELPANTQDNKRKLHPAMEAAKWQPGQSGNPNGRPKKALLTEMTDELLEEIANDPEERAKFKESLKQKLLAKGVVSAMTLDKLWERKEGKVVQPVEGSLTIGLGEGMKLAMEKAEERARNRG